MVFLSGRKNRQTDSTKRNVFSQLNPISCVELRSLSAFSDEKIVLNLVTAMMMMNIF